ncbi:ABC-2 type transporter domain-containing protein [Ditylenchus destructor]|uniref:ABC-2 type transporter domain-containing protein n=1 Tax=Ditylenchus destructor TaxID=166010 RepID=A0AAD4N0X8_9BILA|nr:ABC-2 type transporter domain-containing protein [Ditylenchus destructor]
MKPEDETTLLLRSKKQRSISRQRSFSGYGIEGEPSPGSHYGSSSIRRLQAVTPLGLSWHELSVTHEKSHHRILDNISGMAEPGQFVALMGSSGAGKTTLLNTLISRNLKGLTVSGNVFVNGRELGTSITYVSGYAQQDELFMSTLTVKEHLMIQARLRLVGFTEAQIKRRVGEIITELGLFNCKDSIIGLSGVRKGISGGEARRLVFAGELLNNPAILFCDEPTTGLDSFMAESVVNVMAKMCKEGRTIICTIHQPSSIIYRKFDRVMFLAGGRLAYFGEPSKAVDMLARFGYPCPANYNPADMIIETLSVEPHNEMACRERIKNVCTNFYESTEGQEFYSRVQECRTRVGHLPDMRQTVGFWTQFKTLLSRSMLDNVRNTSLTRAKIIQKVIMGVFIGLLYLQTPLNMIGITNLNGAMFYIVAELTYSTLFGILTFMPADYPLLVREYHDGLYSVISYYIARSMSYVPLFALDGVLMISLAYWLTGFVPTVERFLIALLISVLVEQSAAAFGVMLSTVSPSYPIAISIAGPILTLLSLTGGLYANVGELPVYVGWIQYLSWFRYGFEAFAISQWEGAANAQHCVLNNPCLEYETILNNFSLTTVCWDAIKALAKAFHGKKWNPLRGRVDSVRLDFRQLFIATLFFLVLLFLLPTILVYFLVFYCLWLVIDLLCQILTWMARRLRFLADV